MSERGNYIVIEGHDGTGKSLQVQKLRTRMGNLGIRVAGFTVEEPGGAVNDAGELLVPIATELRKIIKDGTLERDPWTNVILFTAARRVNWTNVIEPALEAGLTVVTARNYYSTIAYQGDGDRVPISAIERRTLEDVGEDYMKPDVALVLSLTDHATREARIGMRGKLEKPDTFESRDGGFQERVRLGYEKYAQANGIPVVDASGTPDEVSDDIWRLVEPRLRR